MTETKAEAKVSDKTETAPAETAPTEQPSPEQQAPKVHPNRAAFDLLAETYPQLFDLKAPKPLKIGIHVSLAEDGKLSKTKIRRALNFYVRQLAYIRAVAAGGKRYDLQGEAGEVSAEDAAHAQARVEEIEAKRAARRQERQQQQKRRSARRKEGAEGRSAAGKSRKPRKPDGAKGKPAPADRKSGSQQEGSAEVKSGNPEERLNAKLENLARRFSK